MEVTLLAEHADILRPVVEVSWRKWIQVSVDLRRHRSGSLVVPDCRPHQENLTEISSADELTWRHRSCCAQTVVSVSNTIKLCRYLWRWDSFPTDTHFCVRKQIRCTHFICLGNILNPWSSYLSKFCYFISVFRWRRFIAAVKHQLCVCVCVWCITCILVILYRPTEAGGSS